MRLLARSHQTIVTNQILFINSFITSLNSKYKMWFGTIATVQLYVHIVTSDEYFLFNFEFRPETNTHCCNGKQKIIHT